MRPEFHKDGKQMTSSKLKVLPKRNSQLIKYTNEKLKISLIFNLQKHVDSTFLSKRKKTFA
ncbi:hypothetical protein ASG14_10085 [Pedobacter sp. Leaf194]|nr:hypothetical protein ASG14_10085 [Pedobacter sp. Leaf194]